LAGSGLAFAAILVMVSGAAAQERTLEELEREAQAPADRNAYPFAELKPEEVREALGRPKSLDRDEWAASWSAIADRYTTRAQNEISSWPARAATWGATPKVGRTRSF
jgi:esterase FrsA